MAVLSTQPLELEQLAFSRPSLEGAGACAAHRIAVTLVDGRPFAQPPKVRFPHNGLRNLALAGCADPYVLMLDADLEAFPPLSAALLTQQVKGLEGADGARRAIVLPSFAVPRSILEPWDRLDVRDAPYANKRDLLELYKARRVRPFNGKFFPRGVAATQYKAWTRTRQVYPVDFESGWEPYLLLRTDVARRYPYDQSFVGFGYNKQSNIEELGAEGFAFVVAPDMFVAHTHSHGQAEPNETCVNPNRRFRRYLVGMSCAGRFFNRLAHAYSHSLADDVFAKKTVEQCYQAHRCLGGCVTSIDPKLTVVEAAATLRLGSDVWVRPPRSNSSRLPAPTSGDLGDDSCANIAVKRGAGAGSRRVVRRKIA
jgi:hypothetical protein